MLVPVREMVVILQTEEMVMTHSFSRILNGECTVVIIDMFAHMGPVSTELGQCGCRHVCRAMKLEPAG